MSQKAKNDAGAKETVLLRQAVPKYNFSARKLPKESSKTAVVGSSEIWETGNQPTTTPNALSVTSFPVKGDNQKTKPVAVVGASLQTSLTSDTGHRKMDTSLVQSTQALSDLKVSMQSLLSASRNSQKKDSWNSGISVNFPGGVSHSSQLSNMSFNKVVNNPPTNECTALSQKTNQTATAALSLLHTDLINSTQENNLLLDERYKKLESEKDSLKKELEVQLQVNSELKRLLVASVGDDLSQRVERLCRDRAQLTLDLGGYSKKMTEEYENLDKVSIQADMWRSKYLASRVMNEELGNARAFYALQCHDTQDALQQMLNERHELRTNLLEVHRVLQQVKSAFDPLNSQRSSTLRSTNVLDLSRSCQQLAEAMRFRLLPAHVAISIDVEPDSVWADSVTHAEQFAHEVLSRPAEPPGSLQSGSSRVLPLTAPTDSQITRFHPHARHENLTYNCCYKCKGEINVI